MHCVAVKNISKQGRPKFDTSQLTSQILVLLQTVYEFCRMCLKTFCLVSRVFSSSLTEITWVDFEILVRHTVVCENGPHHCVKYDSYYL